MRASARFVSDRYTYSTTEEVEHTDRDVRRFYDQNRSDYRRERTYTLDYVMLSKSPAEEDSLLLLNEMNRLRQEVAQAEDDSLFLRSEEHTSELQSRGHLVCGPLLENNKKST